MRSLRSSLRLSPSTLVVVLASGLASLACSAGGGETDGPRQGLDGTNNPVGNEPVTPSGGGEGGGASGGSAAGGSAAGGSAAGGSAAGGSASGGSASGGSASGGSPGTVIVDDNQIGVLDGNENPPPNCGNKELTADEACDDGNKVSGDGCDAECLNVEPGFSCAAPGELCREIARCGDALVAMTEQCDDGNPDPGDGCSERCRIERGMKCEGEPSVCTPAECGDGVLEGAESCDDGNKDPFDGCSSLCLREPNCDGTSCTSGCGDGLLINEDCDDGNSTSGDGCSADCKIENGFTCNQEALCEKVNGECVLRVPAIFRDHSSDEPDFDAPGGEDTTCGIPEQTDPTEPPNPIVPGIAADDLDAEGRPVFGKAPANACIDNAASFATWFREGTRKVSDIILYDNGMGGYVNRFGANGEQLIVTVKTPQEQQVTNACEPGCAERVRNNVRCETVCQKQNDAVTQAQQALRQQTDELTRREDELAAAEDQDPPDETRIAQIADQIETLTAAIEEATADIETLQAAADSCDTDCQTDFDTQVDACVADCKPCSYSKPTEVRYCTGGELQAFDGTPLFFPVDDIMGPTRDPGEANVPAQYGFNGWPSEEEAFGEAVLHNFSFTSEVQYWFRYEADTNATLEFTGDDDVWVFVNGKLAVDLGGIHVPMDGEVTINAQSAARFGLQPGNVYRIAVFQAERKQSGSSFRLTLSGFEATPSDCSAVCGDGILSFGEECDDGKNDGGYGECDVGCKLGPFCGNGIVEGTEACDNGPRGGAGCNGCRVLMVR